MSYYVTDASNPDAPVELSEYGGIRVGDVVVEYDPRPLPPLPGPLTVTAFYEFRENGRGGWVTAILNDGEYEVNAYNLRLLVSDEDNTDKEG